MASPTPPETTTDDPPGPTAATGAPKRRISPFLVVAGIAVVAFVVAFLLFRDTGSEDSGTVASGSQGAACAQAKPDPAYAVAMTSDPTPPRAEQTVFHLSIRHDGKPVTGAKVCMTADMSEMHHEGINGAAKESAAGTYDATLKFGMRGAYAASVVVTEKGRSAVSVPITFQVD